MSGLSLDLRLSRGPLELSVQAELPPTAVGVLGPNGAGKSTLLHAIAGLIPSSGRIAVGGHVLQDTGLWLPPERRRVGVVFQDLRLFPHRTVRDNLRYGARGSLDDAVALLGLDALLDRWPGTLSGGERQRVALARALVCRPRLLLLDEPLSALDTAARSAVLPWLRRAIADAGVPVLVVGHRLDELLALTDRLAVVDAGRLVASGSADEVLGAEAVLELAHRMGLDNVLRVTDATLVDGLIHARVGGRPLVLPPDPPPSVLETGSGLVRLRPEDVLLAIGEVGRTSARNILTGTVRSLHPVAGRLVARVDVGASLSVELTRSAVDELSIAPGVAVRCLFKTTAIRWC